MDTSPWLIRHRADRYPAIVYCGGPWQRLGVYWCLVLQYFNIVSHSSEPSAATHLQVSVAGVPAELQHSPAVSACADTSSKKMCSPAGIVTYGNVTLDNLWVIIHCDEYFLWIPFRIVSTPNGTKTAVYHVCIGKWIITSVAFVVRVFSVLSKIFAYQWISFSSTSYSLFKTQLEMPLQFKCPEGVRCLFLLSAAAKKTLHSLLRLIIHSNHSSTSGENEWQQLKTGTTK